MEKPKTVCMELKLQCSSIYKDTKNIKLLFLYFYLAFLLIPKVYFKSYVIDTTRHRQKVTTEINLVFF